MSFQKIVSGVASTNLQAVWGLNANNVWMAGSGGTLLRYEP